MGTMASPTLTFSIFVLFFILHAGNVVTVNTTTTTPAPSPSPSSTNTTATTTNSPSTSSPTSDTTITSQTTTPTTPATTSGTVTSGSMTLETTTTSTTPAPTTSDAVTSDTTVTSQTTTSATAGTTLDTTTSQAVSTDTSTSVASTRSSVAATTTETPTTVAPPTIIAPSPITTTTSPLPTASISTTATSTTGLVSQSPALNMTNITTQMTSLTPSLTTSGVITANYSNNGSCANDPCKNGGTCLLNSTAPSGYTCHCFILFTGDECEQYIDSPPSCTLENVNVTFLETAPFQSLSQESINCSTLEGFGLLLNYSATTDSDGLFDAVVSDGNPDTDSLLQFKIKALTNLMYKVGVYEVTLYVHNELGMTAVKWSIQVEDINQSPICFGRLLLEDVKEDAAVGTTVAEIQVWTNETRPTNPGQYTGQMIVWDPDNFTESFQFNRLTPDTATNYFFNGTSVDWNITTSQAGLPIQLLDSPLRFEVTSSLSGFFRLQFRFKAVDREGRYDDCEAVFFIEDVNDPPTCAMTSTLPVLHLVTPMGDIIYTLSCDDSDTNATFSSLTYDEYNILDSGYFAINQSGVVTLESMIPLNVNFMTYPVYVIDGGGLSADVNITFTVNRNYPPQCGPRPIASLLEDAELSECVNTTFLCGHDSALAAYDIAVNVTSSTNDSLFDVSYNVSVVSVPSVQNVTFNTQFTFLVCPRGSLLGRFGVYPWDITATSTLGSTTYSTNITVVDTNQPPEFQQSVYHVPVPETKPVGATIARVVTTIGPGSSGFTEIVVLDADTQNQFSFNNVTVTEVVIIYPNSTNTTVQSGAGLPIRFNAGFFSVAYNLSAGVEYRFTLQAKDHGGLTDNTTVVFYVSDLNQAPTCQSVTSVPLDLVTPVGTAVLALSCSDFDVNATLSALKYDEMSLDDYDFFKVNQSGMIFLTKQIPLTSSSLTYHVEVEDGGGLDTNVSITFIVNRDYPPQCSQTAASVTFQETDTLGTCNASVVVTCTDSASRNLTPRIDVVRDDTSGEIGINIPSTAVTNVTGEQYKACVHKRNGFLTVGNFIIEVNVSTVLGSTLVEWNVTVEDVNQPPSFASPNYTTTVSERVGAGTTLAVVRKPGDPPTGNAGVPEIVLADPDTITDNFKIKSVVFNLTVLYLNGTQFEETFNQTTLPIHLVSSAFVVQTALRPDLNYTVKIIAEDGGGLQASTTLYVTVNDVNDPPVCDAIPPVNLTLLAPVASTVVSLSCSDPDFVSMFNSLSYFAYAQADYTFFNVSKTTGDVILAKLVPRGALRLTLLAYAIDGDGLRDNVNITFDVFRNYPPSCNPTIIRPAVWRKDECFRLLPNCQDPRGENSLITYRWTGNFSSAFTENVSLALQNRSDSGTFCYALTTSGNYTIQLTADNGLGTYTWDYLLRVGYLSKNPVFDFNNYQEAVLETASVGTIVANVNATVGDGSVYVPVKYSLKAGDFTRYFDVDSGSGHVQVITDLTPIVNQTVQTMVIATDPDTGLSSEVSIAIEVKDVNQPPSCANASVNVTVPWAIPDDTIVATVTCRDPDPTPAFRTLIYDLIGESTVRVWEVEARSGEVSLRARNLLSPDIGVYHLTIQANDSKFADIANVTINVDRTPPKPTVQWTNLSFNSSTFSWTTDSDYIQVIDGYVVSVRDSQGVEAERANVNKNVTTYTTRTSLNPQTSYSVDVTVKGRGGNVTSDPVNFTTEAEPVIGKASTEILLTNETWTADLMSESTQAFTNLQSRLEGALSSSLSSLPGFQTVLVRSFRRGSVYADVVITVDSQKTSLSVVEQSLVILVLGGSIGGMAVNTTYLPFYRTATYISNLTISTTATKTVTISSTLHIIVGADVTVTCSARTPGISAPIFRWFMNGTEITNKGRYSVPNPPIRSVDDPYGFQSQFVISNVGLADRGKIMCNVSGGGPAAHSIETALTIVNGLRATITASKPVVPTGTGVTLTCIRSAGYNVSWVAELYRAGNNIPQQSANKTSTETSATFNATITARTTFHCNVRDIGGSVSSGNVDVIALQPQDLKCPKDGDWLETPTNATISLPCPDGYEGSFSRRCGSDGRWRPVNSSGCVKKELNDLENIVKEIESGQSTATPELVVDKLANATEGELLQGDVLTAVNILDRVANISVSKPPTNGTLKKFVKSADNILQAPNDVWQDRTNEAFSLVRAVDAMGEAASRGLANGSNSELGEPVFTDKIVLQVGRSSKEDIMFPIPSRNDYPSWVLETHNFAFLSKDALPDESAVVYSAVMYQNLSNVFSGFVHESLTDGGTANLSVNSHILTLTVPAVRDRLQPPVSLTFEHIEENFGDATCHFMDFSNSAKGRWSSAGCRVESSNETTTVCLCDHLTNFAVLMSPYRPDTIHSEILSIITIVGCSISIFCLLVTIIVYAVLWRYVKSDRSVVLVNLCVVLLLAYIVFLAGVSRTENEIACKVVSALLHYLFLVVFFLMLCEGLDIFISVVIIFPIKSVLVKLLLMAYGVPAVVVAVSLGVRLDGYGGPDFCWLSLEDGLLYAFVGPALAALLANFVFVALVIRALLSSTHLLTKSQRERAKSIVKAICVMTPILGLTWVFGVFYVNEETVAFQYLFLIFNTLQGFFIFIFHCLMSKQVREGVKNKKRRYQAKSAAADGAGSKSVSQASQKPTSDSTMSSNDLDKKTTSPFLQVDRQVQQMAAKVSRLEDVNLLTPGDPPKDVAVKDTGVSMPATYVPSSVSNPALYMEVDPDPALNIREEEKKDSEMKLFTGKMEFTIEAGNLKSVSKPAAAAPAGAGYEGAELHMQKVGSLEDNAQQRSPDRRRYSKKSDGSGSKGSSSSSTRPKEINRRKSGQKSPPVVQETEQQRLDHVYGAGARISDSMDARGKKKNVPRVSTSSSSEDVSSFSVHKNPVFNDAVPALSPTDRWMGGGGRGGGAAPKTTVIPVRHQYPADPRAHPQPHPAYPAYQYPSSSFQQPNRPPSPRRLAASAESLGQQQPAVYHPFSGVRVIPVQDRRGGSKKPVPRVAPKPGKGRGRGGWNEPPVDYW